MSDISEEDWKKTLTKIIEDLDKRQYEKMLEYLKITKYKKKNSRGKMPGIIIQHYGVPDSVKEVRDIMEEIPRRDPTIQDLLRPFVDKLDTEQKQNQGEKRKREDEDELESAADAEQSLQPDTGPGSGVSQDRRTPAWRKSIRDVNASGIDDEAIIGKVVQKSGLHKYQTKDKERKFFFYLAVADDTDTTKVMVYGKERYKSLQEGGSYTFRKLIKDEFALKVTKRSKVGDTTPVSIPEELEAEARRLIYPNSPVLTISEAKSSDDKMEMSVEGTVTEINPVENVSVRYKREKTKRQEFHLKDQSDSIRICMWGDATGHCRGLAAGDVVKVTNLKTHVHFDDVSLNSTGFTEIKKVRSVGIQNLKMEITGIIKATKKETHLDVEFNNQLQTFVVSTPLLAAALDFSLKGDVRKNVLDKMPIIADAQIQGNKIIKMATVKEM